MFREDFEEEFPPNAFNIDGFEMIGSCTLDAISFPGFGTKLPAVIIALARLDILSRRVAVFTPKALDEPREGMSGSIGTTTVNYRNVVHCNFTMENVIQSN